MQNSRISDPRKATQKVLTKVAHRGTHLTLVHRAVQIPNINLSKQIKRDAIRTCSRCDRQTTVFLSQPTMMSLTM
ncbi:hypothetical protein L6654_36935 [Bradyrhizobium sp. WYCCWR 13023]|uniref:Uncharacterized protein n=1 Tax=Bradyrhizobium zhengyangense TaxID=2911009 RepID=A0A9X1UJU2_9BRAD|nr:hypothetical protein [Bradyrhizobium zhengyangense]MCG2632207.1 hypothetical protein [Bradyrhizobium zhengyangense]MCG2673021.1 hypothetical protein [Bradyrhizobium zhengyangense]